MLEKGEQRLWNNEWKKNPSVGEEKDGKLLERQVI